MAAALSAIPLLCGTKGVERQRRLAFGVGEKQIINEASGRVAAAAAAAAAATHDDDNNNDDGFAIERRGAVAGGRAAWPLGCSLARSLAVVSDARS